MDKLWFKARSFGWGWTPCSIEGWLVVIGFVMALLAISFMLKEGNVIEYMLWFVSLVALIMIIGYKKGEKPHWSWGKKKAQSDLNEKR
jgi:hypothetical protein